MSNIGKIEAALQAALSTAQGKKEKRPAYLKRLQEGAQESSSEKWDELPTPAQEWVNDATKAANDDKDLPDFEQDGETKEDAKAAASISNEKEHEIVGTKIKKKAAPAKDAKKPAAGKGGRGVKGDGYKGHRVGSNREIVHKVFDEKGAEAAIKKAVALGIKEGSAKSWISSWGGGKKK